MTVTYNKSGELTIDGTSLKTIAQSFGTPTIVYDENQIRQQMRRYHQAFQHNDIGYVLSYASKAFTCIQMIKLVEEEDFDLDVVSEGELYTAIEAGYDPKRIHFHGNNKTKQEIQYALSQGIGYFVVDALDEIALLDEYATDTVDVLIRVNPGVEAHTRNTPYLFGEDFSFYQQLAPSYFVFVGTRNESQQFVHGLHTPRLNFDEQILINIADYYERLLFNYDEVVE